MTNKIIVIVGVIFLILVAAIYIALGGPSRSGFSNSVGTETMGQNQAALSSPIFSDGGSPTTAAMSPTATQPSPSVAAPVSPTSSQPSPSVPAAAPPAQMSAPQQMEQTGMINMRVNDAREAAKSVTNTVVRLGGNINSSNISQSERGGNAVASISCRVPAEKYDEMVVEIHNLGDIISENLASKNQTQNIQILNQSIAENQARIEASRARLAEPHGAAEETAREQAELKRLEAELTTARQNLVDRTSYSQFTITLREDKMARMEALFFILLPFLVGLAILIILAALFVGRTPSTPKSDFIDTTGFRK